MQLWLLSIRMAADNVGVCVGRHRPGADFILSRWLPLELYTAAPQTVTIFSKALEELSLNSVAGQTSASTIPLPQFSGSARRWVSRCSSLGESTTHLTAAVLNVACFQFASRQLVESLRKRLLRQPCGGALHTQPARRCETDASDVLA